MRYTHSSAEFNVKSIFVLFFLFVDMFPHFGIYQKKNRQKKGKEKKGYEDESEQMMKTIEKENWQFSSYM